ncbi:Aminotransferase, class V/Cysteine desulfurase [Corchorus olitorius]|uniref:Aminotransferase, class V/Cysteine desulfurase n=1 Tax=Corchorus olitorius TaxID=93759 RepID=A0A1R3JT36_9ROSI|nr:Aminotransferase, class V/Cysteine desulfurase [Corchorus olitorius]
MKADLKETNGKSSMSKKIQSLCLKEASQVCLHGCCPTPFVSSAHEPQTKADAKRTSTSAACRRDFASKTTSSIFPNTQFTDHESLPSVQQAFSEFTKAYPQYSETYQIDQIRAQEYYHLSFSNHTCLDYLGIGLFSYSQLQKRESPAYRNPSSSFPAPPQSPPPVLDIPFFGVSYKTGNLKTQLLHGGPASELESAIKKRIMTFLNISENDYCMVFTANKTSAFKLLAESYPFQSNRKLLTVYDYESEAIEAMTHSSEKNGGKVMSAEFSWPRLRIQSSKLKKMIVSKEKKTKKKRGLFVFPLHSRMTGARYPYLWMSIAQENGWHVLIDACALGPKDMDSFGLSLFRPDFLICSFYKVFGENPSGFACLFAKKSAVSILETSTSSGMVGIIPTKQLFRSITESPGTDSDVEQTSNSIFGSVLVQASQSGRLEEDQQKNYKIQHEEVTEKLKGLEMAEISESDNVKEKGEIECKGLDQVDSLGLVTISNRARCLINWLVNALLKLQHPNTEGIPLVRIYGPKVKFDRGAAIAFNIFDWKGEKVEPVLVQKLADRSNISLSYGFLHHISFADKYQEQKDNVMERRSNKEVNGTDVNKRKDKNDMGIAVVTAALGFLANFQDIYKLWAFIAQFLDADFVEKERWRYTALNQKTIEV